ncbi:hypothetical protein GGS21DRAFT_526200, partial [Xylaria nigripes]
MITIISSSLIFFRSPLCVSVHAGLHFWAPVPMPHMLTTNPCNVLLLCVLCCGAASALLSEREREGERWYLQASSSSASSLAG